MNLKGRNFLTLKDYTEEEKGQWKRCSRCGEIKLAHNKFFSKNKTSKDGFYSICKKCRNKKTKKQDTFLLYNKAFFNYKIHKYYRYYDIVKVA